MVEATRIVLKASINRTKVYRSQPTDHEMSLYLYIKLKLDGQYLRLIPDVGL